MGQVANVVERLAPGVEGVERGLRSRPGVESGNGEAQRRVIGHELARIFDGPTARAIVFHTCHLVDGDNAG